MIIKAIGVKTNTSVKNVLNYIASDKGRIENYLNQGVFHNLNNTDLEAISHEFIVNYDDYARKRSDGNRALHIMLSVSPLDRNKMSIEIMDDIVHQYLTTAYPSALAFGTHHKSQSHWHSHLLVSANELMSQKGTRLSKQRLKEVHMTMIEFLKEKYPELTIGIDTRNWGKKLHNEREYYQKKRNPGIKLTKDELSQKVQDIFRTSSNSQEFYHNLQSEGFETYNYNDRVQGVYWGGENKKMRFSRLGVEFKKIEELDVQSERLEEIEKVRSEDKDYERGSNGYYLDR